MYIDSHAHFDLCMEDRNITEESLISGLRENNIKYAVQISTDADNLSLSHNFAGRNKDAGILFTLGIHPSSKAGDRELKALSEYAKRVMEGDDRGLLFGIGETGLDYYRMRQPKPLQRNSFDFQIDLAKRWDIPVIVHSREAFSETLEILKNNRPPAGIMHCFPGNRDMAKSALDLGFYISFAGNLTYNKALNMQEAASYVPSDRLLLETDAPFLTPVPLRGKKNRSENVIHTYQFLSELRKEPLEKIQESIYNNFISLISR